MKASRESSSSNLQRYNSDDNIRSELNKIVVLLAAQLFKNILWKKKITKKIWVRNCWSSSTLEMSMLKTSTQATKQQLLQIACFRAYSIQPYIIASHTNAACIA